MRGDDKVTTGCGLGPTTFIVLLILKLIGAVSLSWSWVVAALFIDLALWLVVVVLVTFFVMIIALFKD